MFCFETAFKLLTLSWAAYDDEDPPAGCEALCTLHNLNGSTSDGHSPEAGPAVGGECRCSHGLSSTKEVRILRVHHQHHSTEHPRGSEMKRQQWLTMSSLSV